MKKTILSVISVCLALMCMTSCSAGMSADMQEQVPGNAGMTYSKPTDASANYDGEDNDEQQNTQIFIENPFVSTADNAVSTFSADVDTASYAYFRKLVNGGCNFNEIKSWASGFRTEEMVNYFTYDYAQPGEGEVFSVQADMIDCPWNPDASLLRLGLKARDAAPTKGNNLVFLIDVSGSMQSEDKLPLLCSAFEYLTEQLSAQDTVSIVTYSGREEVVLKGCSGDKSAKIISAVKSLEAKGSTNGEAGLKKAYEIAKEYYIEGGNNRIIMASDGDLNVGISDSKSLAAYVSDMKAGGVYLSILGFGTGNYRDANMEALADNGNGVYYYIDGDSEAEKVFCSDLTSTLYTVADDVKLQLTFSPEYVESYRLVGYENRVMATEDFIDDSKDAGEVGSGHTVTVCYELILTDTAKKQVSSDAMADKWFTLAVRHKEPGEDISKLNEYSFGCEIYAEASDEMRFICAVIETSMLIHDSKYISEQSDIRSLSDVVELLGNRGLNDVYKEQFVELLKKLIRG